MGQFIPNKSSPFRKRETTAGVIAKTAFNGNRHESGLLDLRMRKRAGVSLQTKAYIWTHDYSSKLNPTSAGVMSAGGCRLLPVSCLLSSDRTTRNEDLLLKRAWSKLRQWLTPARRTPTSRARRMPVNKSDHGARRPGAA